MGLGYLCLLGRHLLSGVGAQTIHQWPSTKVKLKGSPLSLECTVKGTSSPNLYWYRQAEGGGPQMLFYSISTGKVDSQAPQNLEASRPQDGYFILRSKKLLLSDSGFYLCAWILTTLSRSPHSGTGWRVFVT
uniref:T cell receptor beta variable 30 n=1 Tax=Myotis lucifugus TaxID=59463 RepID=G1PGL8_MYOLU